MKITYMRYATVQGEALYALLKDEHRDMQVDVADQSPQALRDVAAEMRRKVEREIRRIEFIEAAAAQLEAKAPEPAVPYGWDKV